MGEVKVTLDYEDYKEMIEENLRLKHLEDSRYKVISKFQNTIQIKKSRNEAMRRVEHDAYIKLDDLKDFFRDLKIVKLQGYENIHICE